MSTYTFGDNQQNSGRLTQSEIHLYGSSRLGMWTPLRDVQTAYAFQSTHVDIDGTLYPGTLRNFIRGNKLFELSNHLGNVLATISDKKFGVAGSGGAISYYKPDLITANDYYPFGMVMSGRDDKSLDDALDNGEQNSLTMGTGNQSSNLTATFITQSVDNFTVELWVKPTATHEIDTESPYGYAGISGQKYVIDPVHGGLGAPGDAGMGISVGTNGVSVYEHADGYMPPILVWSGTLTDWTHIAVVYENKQPRLYINGLLVRTGPYSQRTHIYPGNLVASGYYGTMQGQVDEVRVWSVIRTQAQIAASMNSTVSAPQAGLAAYWPLKESDGTTLVDISGNNYNVPLNTSYGTGNWSSSTAALESYRSGYRYGFNGKENDKDISEGGQDYGMRISDARLGRFLSVDPLYKKFPMLTPYQFASNTPIQAIDLDGLEAYVTTQNQALGFGRLGNNGQIRIATAYEVLADGRNVIHESFPANSEITAQGRDRTKTSATGITKLSDDDLGRILAFGTQVIKNNSHYIMPVLMTAKEESYPSVANGGYGLIDFKYSAYDLLGIPADNLIDINGTIYNANEAGGLLWGMVLTFNDVIPLTPSGAADRFSQEKYGHPNEANETKSIKAGEVIGENVSDPIKKAYDKYRDGWFDSNQASKDIKRVIKEKSKDKAKNQEGDPVKRKKPNGYSGN